VCLFAQARVCGGWDQLGLGWKVEVEGRKKGRWAWRE
jgi:hypothetical protein